MIPKQIKFHDYLGENKPCNLCIVSDLVLKITLSSSRKYLSKYKIFNSVSRITGIGETKIRSSVRRPLVIDARNIAIYLMRKKLKMSLIDIGKEFGNRNHSTILHSISQVDICLKTEPPFVKKYNAILELL